MTCRPGHPPRHPDFEPGNTVALTAGHRSERAIAARVPATRAELLEVAPWLADAADADAVARYLRVETRARMLDEWIDPHGRGEGHRCRECVDVGAGPLPRSPGGRARPQSRPRPDRQGATPARDGQR